MVSYVLGQRTSSETVNTSKVFVLVLANELLIYVYNQTWWISSRKYFLGKNVKILPFLGIPRVSYKYFIDF